jgi:hypothetical protein
MPGNAIQAGFATQVLAVEAMPKALEADARLRHLLKQSRTNAEVGKGLSQILARLRNATGHDFAQYKKSTLGRRIERRVVQHGLSDVPGYERYLKAHPDELQALFRQQRHTGSQDHGPPGSGNHHHASAHRVVDRGVETFVEALLISEEARAGPPRKPGPHPRGTG